MTDRKRRRAINPVAMAGRALELLWRIRCAVKLTATEVAQIEALILQWERRNPNFRFGLPKRR